MHRLAFVLLALPLAACQSDPTAEAETPAAQAPAEATAPEAPETVTTTSVLLVDYEGRLDDGTVFDDGQNTRFIMQQLIPGMQDALVGMRAGESKTLSIPPEEAYGAGGIPGVIPPNATLTFDVTVHEILR
ncbi:MAG: FKBP-type peptidyl-prolyl cis-trans isomerase [Bacteroidota bacterium]